MLSVLSFSVKQLLRAVKLNSRNVPNWVEKMKRILTSSAMLLFRFLRGTSGLSAMEYGILVLGIALAAAMALHGLSGSLTDTWDEIGGAVEDASPPGSGDSGGGYGGETGDGYGGETGGGYGNGSGGELGTGSVDGSGNIGTGDRHRSGFEDVQAGGNGTGSRSSTAEGTSSFSAAAIGVTGGGSAVGFQGGSGNGPGSKSGGASDGGLNSGDIPGDSDIGSRFIASADISETESGYPSTLGGRGAVMETGGETAPSTSAGRPSFRWLWILGLTGIVFLPFLYLLKRRKKEN
jgi:Flp pilus assembly pilin Flp